MTKVQKKDPRTRILRSIGNDDRTRNFAEHLWKSCSAFAHADEWLCSLTTLEELPDLAAGSMRLRVTASLNILPKMLSATLDMAEFALVFFHHFRLRERGR